MENITKFVLRRPVTTLLLLISLVFFGLVSIRSSKLELMSSIDMPMLIVTDTYGGASAEEVDEQVIKPIEDAVAELSDVKSINSQASENYGMVMIQYEYGTDIDQRYDDLKKQIDAIRPSLPDDANDPSYMSLNINSSPSIVLAVNNKAQSNMYNYVTNTIEPEFNKLSTAASITVGGGQQEYVSVSLIPEKLKQYHLTMSTVASMVKAADFSYPAGTTRVGSQNLSVTTGVDFDTVESLKNIPITTGSGDTIYLKDIANISTALKDKDSIGRYNGSDTVTMSITKSQEASAVQLSKDVKQEIRALEAQDPNLEITIVNDASDMINSSLSSVFQTMIMAVIISMVIIYFFFGDMKASLIVGTSIPIAILGAFIAMQFMGYSLNMITMSALVLGVGMMVDNSIVVLEACFRSMDKYRSEGEGSRREAAVDSVRTVGASVFGSTATTCVVFIPLAFMSGLSGQFFAPLGFTIVFCMIASFISAVTVVPLCYALYRPDENTHAPAYHLVRRMQDDYRGIMNVLLDHKALVMITSIVLLVLSLLLATKIKTEMMSATDQGQVNISVAMRPGLNIESQDEILMKIEKMVASDPDVDKYTVTSGGEGAMAVYSGGGASVTEYLKSSRSMSTAEKVKYWRKQLSSFPDADITVESENMMSSMSTNTANYQTILTASDYDELKKASDGIVKELQNRPEVTNVHSSLENAAPLVKIKVDPVKAAAEGLSPAAVGQEVHNLISGTEAMTMTVDGQTGVSVMVEYPKDEYDHLAKLSDILISTPAGGTVRLSDIADFTYEDSPSSIVRSDRKYQLTVTADYTEQADQNTALKIDQEVVSRYLNNEVGRENSRAQTSMNEEFASLGQAILIAVFLVFVVMAMQFESMRFSFMVMTTIPFSLIGVFGFLWITNVKITMVALLGFLMLVGTVVNNGILYVDTVNQLRTAMPLRRALIEAGATRLRPILMTTLTTVVSMVPMAMAFGDNGEMMQGLALVDVGGLTASTILSLLMLPVYYVLMDKKKKNLSRDVPEPGYMNGRDPEQEMKRRRDAEDAWRNTDYSEGE